MKSTNQLMARLPKIGVTWSFSFSNPKAAAAIVVFASFIGMVLGPGITNSYGVFEEEYENRFSNKDTGKGALSPAIAIASVHVSVNYLFTTIAGALCERIGMGLTTFIGGVMLGVGSFAAGFCTEVWQLVLTQGVLAGAGVGTIFIVVSTIPTSWFSKNQGFLIGVVHSGSGVGGLMLAPLTRFLINKYTLMGALKIMGVFLAIGITLVSLGMATKPEELVDQEEEENIDRISTNDSVSEHKVSTLAKKRMSVRSFGVRDVHSTGGVLR
ncbi:hypothetical protein IWW49_005201, partial [Coemansia sp. RSA 1797]